MDWFLYDGEACLFIKKETLTQVFSCEFCETFKNTFLPEDLQAGNISFIEGTYQRFILVLYFDSPDIFFVAIFIIDFLDVSSDFFFSLPRRFTKYSIFN